MTDFLVLPETTRKQLVASDPKGSAFVAANAGSGKTYVLARRVTRLLLAGNEPSRILCLTFTKAAAAEMKNRVFKQLREWSSMSDEELDRELTAIEGGEASDQAGNAVRRMNARRLFAQALETPGGLRVQTIHAFCESLLHQFPLEAGIAGHFDVMDDELASLLTQQARDKVVIEAQAAPTSAPGEALENLLSKTSETGFLGGLDELISKRKTLKAWLDHIGGPASASGSLRGHLGFQPEDDASSILAAHFPLTHLTPDVLANYAAVAASTISSTMQEQVERVQSFVEADDDATRLDTLEALLLKGRATTPAPKAFSSFATKPVRESIPALEELFVDEAEALMVLRGKLATLRAIDATADLVQLGAAIVGEVEKAKARRGLLDFDDLVGRTRQLLMTGSARMWVQYKLDQGLDHVLLDEAQDTSPDQWDIIRQFVDEYFAGDGLRPGKPRTVFVVGDEKQSIYSFQGARPELFDHQRRAVEKMANQSEAQFARVELDQSFRSSSDVLASVDSVFAIPENYQGITSENEATSHSTARTNAPGEVEIWPLVEKQVAEEPLDWTAPLETLSELSPEARLAERIADTIGDWISNGNVLRGTGKPVQPDDIIILVRKRGAFMERLTGALKRRALPVAGMDRFALTSHIAVQDLMALGRIVLMPDDDLSLAAVMKSPLMGLTEQHLFDITMHEAIDDLGERKDRSLYAAFESYVRQNPDGPWASAFASLQRWMGLARRYGVFGFFSAVLHTDGGRARLLQRLGTEAEDPIDSFVDLALAREHEGVPGLDGFLSWLETTEPEIKRELEDGGGQIRIMTTHGAKGLEASVVFLVDPGNPPTSSQQEPRLIEIPSATVGKPSALLWQPPKTGSTPSRDAASESRKILQAQEYRRLLYVGMTRAADRLIICGYQKQPTKERIWQAMVKDALVNEGDAADLTEITDEDGNISAWRWCLDADQPPAVSAAEEAAGQTDEIPVLPASLRRPVSRQEQMIEGVTPSTAAQLLSGSDGQAADLSLVDDETELGDEAEMSPVFADPERNMAFERGNAVHRLLEAMPQMLVEARSEAMRAYLQSNLPDWPKPKLQEIVSDVEAVLQHPDLEAMYITGARAEVPIVSTLQTASGLRTVSGKIDLLHAGDDVVTIIDYKTNRLAPQKPEDCPEAYLLQMAIYRHVLSQIYPQRQVRAALVWTAKAHVMFLPTELLDTRIGQILST